MNKILVFILVIVICVTFANALVDYDEVIDYQSIKYIQGDLENNQYDRSKSVVTIPYETNIDTECFGEAETSNDLTSLITTVSFDSSSNTGLHVKNEMTWDGSPAFSVKDFNVIGYNSHHLTLDISSIKATTKIYFSYEKVNKWGNVVESGYDIYTENLSYSNNKDIIHFGDGIVWDIENIYRNYPMGINDSDYPSLYNSNGEKYDRVTIEKIVYTLECDLVVIEKDSFKDLSTITIWGDYRHTYPGIRKDNFPLFITADGTRRNDIIFKF